MAYSSRRSGASFGLGSSSVGQRRPPHPQIGSSFVAGGQLVQYNKPVVQMPGQQQGHQPPAQRQQPQQHKPSPQPMMGQRQQQPLQNRQQQPPPSNMQLQQQQQPSVQQLQQPKIEEKSLPVPDNTNGNVPDMESDGDSDKRFRKTKPFWMRKDGKINKKERLRRRNQRLRKILQPKNALMVLNELIGSAPYNMTESVDMYEGTVFRCTVLVDGLEHVGIGKSKPAAKTAAAEAALKHMVLSKLRNTQPFDMSASSVTSLDVSTTAEPPVAPMDSDVDIKMEIEDDNLGGISWSHVACYALHKLLSSWDEGANFAEKSIDDSNLFETSTINANAQTFLQLAQAATGSGPIASPDKAKTFEKKPAKKLPEAAAMMNPIMLLNQMHPSAVYEEVRKVGNPPHVVFTMKCTVGNDAFLGKGSTKKGARKMCAFAACKKILGIQYTPAFLEEHGYSDDAVTICSPTPDAAATSIEAAGAQPMQVA